MDTFAEIYFLKFLFQGSRKLITNENKFVYIFFYLKHMLWVLFRTALSRNMYDSKLCLAMSK